jgi:hypothetical protein
MSDEAELVSDMLSPEMEATLKRVLSKFYASGGVADIWPGAMLKGEPDRLPIADVRIRVVPLDRIGAPAGASGAGVYVAYFSHKIEGASKRIASQPLVVKIGPARKLREEKEGAGKWPIFPKPQMSRFAFPILYDDIDAAHDRAVLLAPFQSQFRSVNSMGHNEIEVHDLWHILYNEKELSGIASVDWQQVSILVAQAIDAMEPPHQAGMANPLVKEVVYAEQYERYLRKTTQAGGNSRNYLPAALFGDLPVTTVFGREWPNPTSIVRRIVDQGMSYSGVIGPVHGDLHPKNIVLDTSNSVQIIDFGWATDDRPVVVDYLLLDLNLRGTTLPSQVSEEGILQLARFLRPEHDASTLPDSVRSRARVIQDVIWHKANTRVVQEDWTKEYMIPLFLVGYGLLVHLDSARNQPALVATVLQLAQELDTVVPSASVA